MNASLLMCAPAVLAVLAVLCLPAAGAPSPPESAAFAQQRTNLKQRSRRIIYNSDGCDAFQQGADTPDGFLAKRMVPALDTQVDSVFYCTGATTMFTHRVGVGETYGRYIPDNTDPFMAHLKHNLEALAEAGHDPLALTVSFCHQHELEVFFTHRINDIHDSFMDVELSTWKREHPEYQICAKGLTGDGNDPRRWWSALDFEQQAVRDYLIAIVEDVCARYDIDGYDVDYFRSPMFFKPNLTYEPATAEQIAILTAFQRRIRDAVYRAGNRRGRPMLVSVRVPMTVAACRHVGIDIERWLAEGLLDVLATGGGYIPFTMPTRELVELGHAHGVQVYPTISGSGMRGQGGRHGDIACWRGAAANAWSEGADGILLFNTFPGQPSHPHFTELGDPAKLAGLDKRFVVDNQAILEGDLRQGIVQAQILPVALDAPDGRTVVLPVGDDLAAAAARIERMGLRIRFAGREAGDVVRLTVNGHDLGDGAAGAEDWFDFTTRPDQWRRGDNHLRFGPGAGMAAREAKASVQAVELTVDYAE